MHIRVRRRAVALGLAYACLGLVSCDDPLAPDSSEVGRVEFTVSTLQAVVGDSRTLSARVIAVDGSTLSDRRLYWATQDPGIATVSQSGVVTAIAPGNTQVAVSTGGKSAVVPVTVTPRPVTQVRIVPSTANVQVGRTVTLRADPVDATGSVVAGRTVLWASTATAIATVTSTGVITGISAGATTVSATVDGVIGAASVTVTPIPVTAVTVSPGSGSLIVGQTIQLGAATTAAGGQTLTGRVVTWSSSANSVASVSSTGLVTAISPGPATVTATSEGVSGTSTITVTAIPVASIRVTPDPVTVAAGQVVQLVAQALDGDGNVLNRPLTWSSDLPTRATVSASGLVTALTAGEVRISARNGNVVGTATVTVTQVPIARIDVTPTTTSVLVGGTQQMTATPRDASGTALPGRSITWLTGAPSVATVSQSGLVTGVSNGSALVFAASEGQSGSAAVTVATVAVTSVTVTPASGNIQQGQALQLTATARDAGNTIVTGRPVTWTSTDETRATVSSTGRVVAIAAGSVTIRAAVEGVTGSGTFTVTPVPVASVSVAPSSTTLAINQPLTLTASLFDATGAPLSTSGRVILYGSSNPAVAAVTTQGLVTGLAAGTAFVTVTCEGQQATATITVSPVPVASVTLSPTPVSLNQGATQAVTATARDAANNILTGRPVTWSSGNPTVATVSTSTTSSSNTITAVAAGSATITAVVQGITGFATVTVTQVPIATITVTGTTSVVEAGTTTLTATARDAANNVLTGRTIVWSSSNPQVSVSQAGVVTPVINSAAQSATITASSPGGGAGGSTPSGTSTVTVTFAPVATVASTPATATVSVGNTQQLNAALATAGAQSLNATGRTITWTPLDAGIATVNASGLVTAVAPGVARIEITASSPGQATPFPRDTTLVTVNNVAVASVTVAPKAGPNPGTVHIGATYARKFVATVRDAGGTQLTGRSVVWTVNDGTKALVTQDADSTIVTGLTAGAVTLTATSEGIPGSIATAIDLVPVSSVAVSPSTATLNYFSAPTQQLTAAPLDSAGSVIVGSGPGGALGSRTTSWSSSASVLAGVNGTGLVTATLPSSASGGAATITATIDGVPGSAAITVLAPVSNVALVVSPDSLILPGTLPGNVTLRDGASNLLSGRSVTLSSSNAAVASVSPLTATSSGTGTVAFTVTGVGAGTAVVTASSEGVSQTFTVRILNPVASVAVAATPDSVIGTAGAPVPASATLRDVGNVVLTGRPIAWSSTTPAVATVDAVTGVITALGLGSTTITATAEGVNGTRTFRVLAPVNSISTTTPGDSIFGTGTLQVTAAMLDASSAPITGRPISWTTTNGAAATVSTSGLVTGVAAGTANIIASVEGKADTVTVRVLAGIASLALTPATDSIIGMGTLALTSTTTPVLQGRAITVTSSSTGVATVNPASATTGAAGDVAITVTSVALGTTTLTVSAPAEGRSTTRLLRMLASVASVNLTSPGDSIIGTGTLQLTATLLDASANTLTGRPVTWTSLTPGVATVSTSGLVTGVASDSSKIIAAAEGKADTLTVRVLPAVATVALTAPDSSVLVTQSVTATAVARDASNNVITGRPVTWVSSLPAKATVSGAGLITAVDSGTTNITATVGGITSTAIPFVVSLVPAATLSIAPATVNDSTGKVIAFTATPRDSANNVLTGRAIAWSSSNTSRLQINPSTGSATLIDSGSVTVTATTSPGTGTGNSVSATAAVTITHTPVSSVIVPPTASVAVGASTSYTANVVAGGGNAASRSCTMTSSNVAIVTVTAATGTTSTIGTLTVGISGVASGSANVTVTCEGKSAVTAVTVP
jgi:uncharacterized protein YjdB